MTSYRHLILPAVLVGAAALASVFATFIAGRFRHTRQGGRKAALAIWEDEGGSVAAAEAVAPAGDDITSAGADRNLDRKPQ